MDALGNLRRLGLCALLGLGAPVGARAAGASDAACLAAGCHDGILGHPRVHEPLQKQECSVCHPVQDGVDPRTPEHQGVLRHALAPARGAASCIECHEDAPPFHAEEPAPGTDACLGCHDPHGGDDQALLRASDRESCMGCHERDLAAPRPRKAETESEIPELHRHGPLEVGRCLPCHSAHRRNGGTLLRGTYPEGSYAPYAENHYEACLGSCHEPALVEAERTTEATAFRNGDENLHYQHVARPQRGRSCRLCHVVHQSYEPALVRRRIPFGAERLTLDFEPSGSGGRCATTCHMPLAYDRDDPIASLLREEPTELDGETP